MSADQHRQRASSDRLEQAAASDVSITDIHQQLLREKPEPTEGFSPMPIFLLFVFAALVFTGGIYIAQYSGGFDPLVFDVAKGRVEEGAGEPQQVDPMVLGERFYNSSCLACHGASGAGVQGAFPPLTESDWVLGSEERIIRIVLHGLTGPITVNGQDYNNVMPAHGPQSPLRWNAERVAAVLTYVRGSWGNDAPPVKTEQVEEVIAATSDRPPQQAWTAEELAEFE